VPSIFQTSRKRIYRPHGWTILKVELNNKTFYKVYGSFSNDSWRLSSGANDTSKLIEKDDGEIEWEQDSGSTYIIQKSYEHQLSFNAHNILQQMLISPPVAKAKLEVVCYSELISHKTEVKK